MLLDGTLLEPTFGQLRLTYFVKPVSTRILKPPPVATNLEPLNNQTGTEASITSSNDSVRSFGMLLDNRIYKKNMNIKNEYIAGTIRPVTFFLFSK